MDKKNKSDEMWYLISNTDEVYSPALLIYPDRIEHNIRKMIAVAGNTDLLRPHVKTHKMAGIVRLQMSYGIHKFKCSTIAEVEMVASCGADDILLAYQPVGPNIERFFQVKRAFPNCKISCIVDTAAVIKKLSDTAVRKGTEAHLWLDINNGMNRTGIVPGEEAEELYKMIVDLPMLRAEGLHVYDGHIREKDFTSRQIICDEAFVPVTTLMDKLKRSYNSQVSIVAGGTPTFPIHALRNGVETSPGTLLLWDYGYSSFFSDMEFLHAAVLFTRVVSKPGEDLICLDLGHKAIASEMPQPRIKIFGMENYSITGHNEEHMVVKSPDASKINTGDYLFGIPYHICPTVDRYESVTLVEDGKATRQWNVDARKRKITY